MVMVSVTERYFRNACFYVWVGKAVNFVTSAKSTWYLSIVDTLIIRFGSPIPRFPHSQGPTARAVFDREVRGLNPSVQNLDYPENFFITCCGVGSILTPSQPY